MPTLPRVNLLRTGMKSSLLASLPVFFVCGPGLKKSAKDLCQRIGVFAFSVSPSQVGIVAASAAAYGYYFMFSVATAFVCFFSQVASRAAAAWRAGAFVYIFCVEGVFLIACVFGQIVRGVKAFRVSSLSSAAEQTDSSFEVSIMDDFVLR